MMKKMISWMGVMGALVSSAYAASATVWSAEDGNGTVPPVGAWYKYPTKTTNGATATFVTDSIHGYKTLKASVSATNESSAAGMGFAVMFVMTLATIVTFLIYYSFLQPYNLTFMITVTFILVIAALVQMVEIIIKKVSQDYVVITKSSHDVPPLT